MDQNQLRVLIGAAGGALIGSGVTYLLTKRRYERILADEITSVKEAFTIRLEAAEQRIEAQEPTEDVIPTPEEIADYEATAAEYGTAVVVEEKTTLVLPPRNDLGNGYAAHLDQLEREAKEQEEQLEDQLMVDGQPMTEERYDSQSGTKVIGHRAFFEENQHFSKLTVRWFKGDQTLADEQDVIVPSPIEVIGSRALQLLQEDARIDTVYARNTRTSCDFEILIEAASFDEVVLGIVPSEQPG